MTPIAAADVEGWPVAFADGPPGFFDRAGLAGDPNGTPVPSIGEAGATDRADYLALRRDVFCREQGLFDDDADDTDVGRHTVVLVARAPSGEIIGGVRVAPVGDDRTSAWWTGSRLAVRSDERRSTVGAELVRAACALAEQAGALRFDATVQPPAVPLFARLGWRGVGPANVAGSPHVAMTWPIQRIARLVRSTKAPLGPLLGGLHLGGPGFVGDDGAPVPGSDLVAATDAIVPSMVERDPDWAGWCAVVVNVNDLAAMGAAPLALLDALGAPSVATASAALDGMRCAADAYRVPIVGGHTQLGVPAALAVTAIGRARHPVPGGGGRPGDVVRLTADIAGGWRPGYSGTQWDSTTARSGADLAALTSAVATTRPVAAKDVSMAGVVGTLAMLAEASGCGAELSVAAIPRPAGVRLGDWLTCFPGFAVVSADRRERDRPPPLPPSAVSAPRGRLVPGDGVTLVWPDGRRTPAVTGPVTGLGPARPSR